MATVLVLIVLVLFTLQEFLPGYTWGLAGALLLATVAGQAMRAPRAVHAGLLCTLTLAVYAVPIFGSWPLPLAAAVAAYAAVTAAVPGLRPALGWARRGALDRPVALLVLVTVAASGAALLLWFQLVRPDLAEFRARIPDLPAWALPLAALGFAMLNAAAEEAAYRGILMEALDGVLGPGLPSVLIQAAAFGIIHLDGFPQGLAGVLLASVYGLLLGLIRRRARGMLAPWLAHVGADVAIFTIVLLLV